MKLSLSWIFDHIQARWQDYDIPAVIAQFNKITAETEDCQLITYDVSNVSFATVIECNDTIIKLYCREWEQEILLPYRVDAKPGLVFLIKRSLTSFEWLNGADFYSAKVGVLPAFRVGQHELMGSWKDTFEKRDYIITLDNKSITHRPDLWGHRGFAREIAAQLGVQLVPEEHLLAPIGIKNYSLQSEHTDKNHFSVAIDGDLCKRLACLYLPEIRYEHSLLWMAHRLLRVDSRPIAMTVDTTNYVMFDIGQPMHAFDAQTIANKQIIAGPFTGQDFTLLDGETIRLTASDCTINDGNKPLALAGIMGGQDSSVTCATQSLLLEAGCFDAMAIRKTSARVKKRTESSSRFEKSLDPYAVTKALQRFIKILDCNAIVYSRSAEIVAVGVLPVPLIIDIQHEFLENRIGVSIDSQRVITILCALDFHVTFRNDEPIPYYHVKVPTFRSTKDVLVREDIIEEVGRYIGFDTIIDRLPAITTQPVDMKPIMRMRSLKNYFAFSVMAREVRNYALFDEEFLATIGWQPVDFVSVLNPVSEHYRRLVTSLVPHLLKNIKTNIVGQQQLQFFECNRVWQKQENILKEIKKVAFVSVNAEQSIDFYEQKYRIEQLFHCFDLSVTLVKVTDIENLQAWYHPYQTAYVMLQGRIIGMAGMANPGFTHSIFKGNAFIMELNTEPIITTVMEKKFTVLPKFPDAWLDISMLINVAITVEQLTMVIQKSDYRIFKVELIDYFQKPEWHDQRSVTVRFYARDKERTLTKGDIDHMYAQIVTALQEKGVHIR